MVISGPKKLMEIVKNLIEIKRDVDSRYNGCGSVVVLFGAEVFEREFSIMTVVKWGVNRLVDVLCQMSDCFDLVYDVAREGRVWV